MKKTLSLLIGIALFGCAEKKNAAEADQKHYNILWIVADDLGTDLGCYGNNIIHTPNLDQLASESVLYTNLNTVTAVCSPSRSSLITGMYPVTLGVHEHRTQYKKELPQGIEPVTEYFKEAGYFVTNGKGNPTDKGGKTDYNFEYKASDLYQAGHWSKRAEGQPFFSQIQIFYPHRPFHNDSLNPIDHDSVVLPPYYPDHELLRKDWALYLETIQLVDQKMGEIMDHLKEEGILENTVVFFFGDQGRPHVRAKQFLYSAGTNTPLMVRWPDGKGAGKMDDRLVSNLDIPVASMNLAGIQIPDHIQGRDFLGDHKREYVFTMRDRRDETVDRIRAVRNQKFKYIKNYYPERPYMQPNVYKDNRYPARPLMRLLYEQGKLNDVQSRFVSDYRPEEELYDLENDPHEINNLASNPQYMETLETLRAVLEKWVAENNKGTYPEDQREIDHAYQLMMGRRSKMLKDRHYDENVTDQQMVDYWMKRYQLE
ncbi:sulfatase [Flagellimonas sp. MMG031]|uniref:Sulfatase n=1 Tax=Flagellimonas sp. MMG031 TaxID=3158549 RepID=A0AAU7MX39_9FLAO